jgi:hypothetical protein
MTAGAGMSFTAASGLDGKSISIQGSNFSVSATSASIFSEGNVALRAASTLVLIGSNITASATNNIEIVAASNVGIRMQKNLSISAVNYTFLAASNSPGILGLEVAGVRFRTAADALQPITMEATSYSIRASTTDINLDAGRNINLSASARIGIISNGASTVIQSSGGDIVLKTNQQIICQTAVNTSAADPASTHPFTWITHASTQDGGINASSRGWTITASGHFIPLVGSASDVGSSARPIRSLYMSGSTLFMDNTAVIAKVGGDIELAVDTLNSTSNFSVSATNSIALTSGSSLILSTPTGATGPIRIIAGSNASAPGSILIQGANNANAEASGGVVTIRSGNNALGGAGQINLLTSGGLINLTAFQSATSNGSIRASSTDVLIGA